MTSVKSLDDVPRDFFYRKYPYNHERAVDEASSEMFNFENDPYQAEKCLSLYNIYF